MDFIDGLPKSQGRTVIMVVVDPLTKYAHFIGLTHPYTTKSVAQLFLDHVFKLHGLPNIIVSDKDAISPANLVRIFQAARSISEIVNSLSPSD